MEATWSSVVPPLLAIGLALTTRKVIPALGAAILIGALIAGSFVPTASLINLGRYAWGALTDSSHLGILAFSVLLGGLIGVMGKSGEQERLARLLTRHATTRTRGQVSTWVAGLVIFFDDYVNSLVIGSAMRPIFDKLGISREKLAFLVDATAAPVVSLALVSSWIAVEIGYINDQYSALGLPADGLVIFVQTLPYRFYPWFMLIFGLAIATSGRDFGPMALAEARAAGGGSVEHPIRDDSLPETQLEAESAAPSLLSALPIVVLVLVAMGGMVVDGALLAGSDGVELNLANIFMRARSHFVLVAAALSGNLAVLLIARMVRGRDARTIGRDWIGGAKHMLAPVGILILAWALSTVCRDLRTAQFFLSAIGDGLSPGLLPAAIFVLAGVTSFATGTSWGTMALLFPLVVPLAHGISSGSEEVMLGSVSSILAGAVWGDHCSPISDTTIMSSLASGCDHVAHVKTQLPYALVVGAVSLVCGDLATGLGVLPPWGALALGSLSLILVVRFAGRTPNSTPP